MASNIMTQDIPLRAPTDLVSSDSYRQYSSSYNYIVKYTNMPLTIRSNSANEKSFSCTYNGTNILKNAIPSSSCCVMLFVCEQ